MKEEEVAMIGSTLGISIIIFILARPITSESEELESDPGFEGLTWP